jgi:rhodanese-related sulfurtransferase
MSSASTITTISAEQLEQRLQKGAFQFWNVLSDKYFNGELIVGSLRVPSDNVGREAAQLGLPKSAEIVVYCKDKDCTASDNAADKLQTLGFTNVLVYKGGLVEWKESGRSLAHLKTVGAVA